MKASSRDFVEPAFDMVTALLFLTVWIMPGVFGDDIVVTAVLIILMEFLVIHASFVLGKVVFSASASAPAKFVRMALLSLGYLAFVAVFAAVFGELWPFWAFAWLLAGKVFVVFRRDLPPADRLERMEERWVTSMLLYLVAAVVSIFAYVLPALGIGPEHQRLFSDIGTGLWADHPHTSVVGGCFYFAALAVSRFRALRKTG